MVGVEGFEPPTLCSQSRCATKLRYTPTMYIIGQQVCRFDVDDLQIIIKCSVS